MDINLFNPVFEGLGISLLISYLLGIVHGITPDEHTWPITFSYAIGSYGATKGAERGAIFSLGFTVQRALMSEAIFLLLMFGVPQIKSVFSSPLFFGGVYILVGIVMFIAGNYVMTGNYWPHLEVDRLINRAFVPKKKRHEEIDFYSRDVSSKMAFIHGLIAGFGFGAFALIIYFIFVPAMPNAYVAFLPGLLFGLGTMTMQFIFGAVFGAWITKVKKIGKKGLQFLARYMSSHVLVYGGLTFLVAGVLVLLFPQISSFAIVTPLQVHNLHDLGVGFFIVIFVVVVIGIISYEKGIKMVLKRRELRTT
ncbi:MAG: hypothetical protein OH316_01715 [Candidatus Parvarchaeota archaeon]|nr:hypothetical protein [Candidatus Parvarchaeota archaeon]